jgi:hypothetical protein
MRYGVLKTTLNTGSDSEILMDFVAPLSVTSQQTLFSSDTLSLKRKTSTTKAQRWLVTTNLTPENGTANYLAHSVQYGCTNPFFIRMPQTVPSKCTGVTVKNVVNVGATTVNFNNTSSANRPNIGEYVTFANDYKVYMIVGLGDSNGDGYTIFPGALTQKVVGEALTCGSKVSMRCLYDVDAHIGIKYVDGVLSDPGEVKFVELV